MIKNKNYLAIPANSPNPASALVFANYMASVDSQASKLEKAGMPVGIDLWRLPADEAAAVGTRRSQTLWRDPGRTGCQHRAGYQC